MWNRLKEGEARLVCKSCENAKVIFIQPKGSSVQPPWDLWARIFQWLGRSPSGEKWRIFWYPATTKRQLPYPGTSVGPSHINGGYSYSCRHDTIVIYRLEEATRVLIHEILHAACLDPPTTFLPWREATTETWAELFLIAIVSEGKGQKAAQLWKKQSQWIVDQDATLQRRFGIRGPDDYVWRYTLGREDVLRQLHVPLPPPKSIHSRSARFTDPSIYP